MVIVRHSDFIKQNGMQIEMESFLRCPSMKTEGKSGGRLGTEASQAKRGRSKAVKIPVVLCSQKMVTPEDKCTAHRVRMLHNLWLDLG
jgi:hypothetical protein